MTGIEILAAMILIFGSAAGGMVLSVVVHERRKRRFLERVARALGPVIDIESGDVERPLAFTLGRVRVEACLRGDEEVWLLTRTERGGPPTAVALVERGWRAPDADMRALPEVGSLTPRLGVHGADEGVVGALLARARGPLAQVLGRAVRSCSVGAGRAALEVVRRGLDVDELEDALLRLEALAAVFAGRDGPRLLPARRAALDEPAICGPGGVPVPALTG